MRGKDTPKIIYEHGKRITPAYAGKSGTNNRPGGCIGDHPRVCGEKTCCSCSARTPTGSPPRMRGKERHLFPFPGLFGITPAYAGKSAISVIFIAFLLGSPPRMRGKVVDCDRGLHEYRITPAYAGKRSTRLSPSPASWDHPRVCGEKVLEAITQPGDLGSPPRMRGKVTIQPSEVNH